MKKLWDVLGALALAAVLFTLEAPGYCAGFWDQLEKITAASAQKKRSGEFISPLEAAAGSERGKLSYAQLHYNQGVEFQKKGNFEEALKNYRKSLEMDPRNAKAFINMGIAFYMQDRLNEAIFQFRSALEIDPNDAKAHFDLGLALDDKGDFKEAILHFQKAVEIDPGYHAAVSRSTRESRAYYGAAIASAQRGDLRQAIAYFKKTCELGDDKGCGQARELQKSAGTEGDEDLESFNDDTEGFLAQASQGGGGL
ncbi:MAG: tetratricopeptide repeat protein [Elusimicrobia bacterium]|nr:tetratricopeptide repeat protein [Elusimicrobiota bacterium]